MVSIYTPNINLEEPARGDQVGTWDTPVNSNMTLLDLVVGGVANITLNNSPVVLSAAQFQAHRISFSSTLTGNVPIIFPSTFNKSYVIRNATTGSSAFVVTLTSTVAGSQTIACPPGDVINCYANNGALQYENLGRVGTYWDYAGSSVPAWVTACTVPPYLNCDGSAFSATTYPALAAILGGTTLPDARGRFRASLDQATGRLIAAAAGFDGNTRGAGGGDQWVQNHLHSNLLTDPGHQHGPPVGVLEYLGTIGTPSVGLFAQGTLNFARGGLTSSSPTGITITNALYGSGNSQNVPPAYVGGLTLIRSA